MELIASFEFKPQFSRLKIAVNTRLLLKDHMEGIGWYTHELMSRITRNHPETEFYFFFDRPFQPGFVYGSNVHPVVLWPPARHVFSISFWFDFSLRRALKRLKPDLFFSPDSINMKKPVCRTITTLHDINFLIHPQNLPFLLRRFYARRTPSMVQRSDVIVTVSENSAREIERFLAVPVKKIKVIYNAARPVFRKISPERQEETRKKFSAGKNYFLFIGGMYHRKNLLNLVKAFELFRKKDQNDTRLLLVGKKVRDALPLLRYIESSAERKNIILTGRLNSEEDIAAIMASAMALTCLSVSEGFGMPMAEAMKYLIPILAYSLDAEALWTVFSQVVSG